MELITCKRLAQLSLNLMTCETLPNLVKKSQTIENLRERVLDTVDDIEDDYANNRKIFVETAVLANRRATEWAKTHAEILRVEKRLKDPVDPNFKAAQDVVWAAIRNASNHLAYSPAVKRKRESGDTGTGTPAKKHVH
jgi:hypothetical protein